MLDLCNRKQSKAISLQKRAKDVSEDMYPNDY